MRCTTSLEPCDHALEECIRPKGLELYNRLMNARLWSLSLVIASVLLPYFALANARQHIHANYDALGFQIEGKAVVGLFVLWASISCVLCLVGLFIGLMAYRKLTIPRPFARTAELMFLALPVILWVLLAETIFLWVVRG